MSYPATQSNVPPMCDFDVRTQWAPHLQNNAVYAAFYTRSNREPTGDGSAGSGPPDSSRIPVDLHLSQYSSTLQCNSSEFLWVLLDSGGS